MLSRTEIHHMPPRRSIQKTEEDQLGKFEGDIAAARAAVKGGKRKKASESDPGEEEPAAEPAGPKPKRARKDRKAAAKSKVKATAAATAPVLKRPAAAITPLLKRPAAAGHKVDKFNIDAWLKENATSKEAKDEPIRRYFVSRVHNRIEKPAKRAGLPEAAV